MQALLDLYDKDPKPRPILSSATEQSHSRWYLENLTLDRRLGVGTYSKVFSAHSFDGSVCVLKILDDLTPSEATEYLKKLIAVSQFSGSLAHSLNVVQIYRFESRVAWKGNMRVHQIVVTSQKMANSLWDLHKEKVRLNQPWTQDQLIKILISICNALSEASKKDTPHYDVHERNIFIEEKKSIFLLGDFGVPKIIKKRMNLGPYVNDYLAPEAQGLMGIKDPIDFYKLDVYALGLVVVKLMSMKENFPIKDRSKIQALLKEKANEYPLLIQILEKQMLAADPNMRQDAKNVKYYILTISFDLAFSTIKMQDMKVQKATQGMNNLETKEEMREGYDVAQAYQYFGLYEQASFEYSRVLTSCQKHEDYTKESANIHIMCAERIGVMQIELGNYAGALETLNKLSEYMRSDAIAFLIGDNHPLYIHLNHYLAVIYYHLDNIPQAMFYLEQAHELGKQKNSTDSEVNVKIRDHYMGIMRFLKCDYGKSLDHMLSVADFLTGVTRRDPLDTIDSLLMVANYYRSLKGHQLALNVFLKAKEMIMEAHGDKSEEYINVMREIATTQKSLKDLKGAFNIQLNMLEKIRQSDNKTLFADSLMELADTLFGQRKYTEAIFSAEMAFKVFNRLYWLRHDKTLKAFKFLMNLVKKSPNKEALKHYQKLEGIMISESIIRQQIARREREASEVKLMSSD